MNPFVHCTKTLVKHGIAFRYLPRAVTYYLKFCLFEHWRLLEILLYRNKIKNYQLPQDPIFILGYYRSGTTHLQELLLQDPNFGYMNYYQGIACNSFLVSEKWFRPILGRVLTMLGVMNPAHNLPLSMSMTMEEDIALVSSGFHLASNWGQVLPHRFKWFFDKTVFFETCSDEEKSEFRNFFHWIVKRVSMAENGKRLVMKSPPQLARVRFLKELYPNAKFIFIQRNCYDVFKSNLKLWGTFEGQHLRRPSPEDIRENIFWSLDKSLQYYEDQKSCLGQNQLVEVSYDELQREPLGVVKKIYSNLGLQISDSFINNVATFLQARHGHNIFRYTWNEDEVAEVKSRLAKWIDEYGHKAPVAD